eukprot:scaffold89044_cov67-Attheya_sp.AAC.1
MNGRKPFLPTIVMSLVTLSGGMSAGPGTGRGIVCLIAFLGLSHHVFGQIETEFADARQVKEDQDEDDFGNNNDGVGFHVLHGCNVQSMRLVLAVQLLVFSLQFGILLQSYPVFLCQVYQMNLEIDVVNRCGSSLRLSRWSLFGNWTAGC